MFSLFPRLCCLGVSDQLRNFFALYNPRKLRDAETLLQKFQGRERLLFATLERHYGKPVLLPFYRLEEMAEALLLHEQRFGKALASQQYMSPRSMSAEFSPFSPSVFPATPSRPSQDLEDFEALEEGEGPETTGGFSDATPGAPSSREALRSTDALEEGMSEYLAALNTQRRRRTGTATSGGEAEVSWGGGDASSAGASAVWDGGGDGFGGSGLWPPRATAAPMPGSAAWSGRWHSEEGGGHSYFGGEGRPVAWVDDTKSTACQVSNGLRVTVAPWPAPFQ